MRKQITSVLLQPYYFFWAAAIRFASAARVRVPRPASSERDADYRRPDLTISYSRPGVRAKDLWRCAAGKKAEARPRLTTKLPDPKGRRCSLGHAWRTEPTRLRSSLSRRCLINGKTSGRQYSLHTIPPKRGTILQQRGEPVGELQL